MKRFQMLLTPELSAELHAASQEHGMPVAQLIRRYIRQGLDGTREPVVMNMAVVPENTRRMVEAQELAALTATATMLLTADRQIGGHAGSGYARTVIEKCVMGALDKVLLNVKS